MAQLVVSEDESWIDAFGVAPQAEEASGDEYVREVQVPTGAEEELQISWDVVGSSVRFRHRRAGRVIVDLHRENATLLRIETVGKTTALVMEYAVSGASGRARIQVWPDVLIKDVLLSC